MGLASFRVRLFIALLIILVVWQWLRIWSPLSGTQRELSEDIRVKDGAEVGGRPSQLQKVLVTVYYEALCPDSRSFFRTQALPTFQALEKNIEFQLVPYGKAETIKTDSGYEFHCQHGRLECEANIIHACSIDIIEDPATEIGFITCMIRNNLHPENVTKTCGQNFGVDVKSILDCQAGSRGKELLAMYGEMTKNVDPEISFIPTITLDKEVGNQPSILKNLLATVCQLYKVLPPGCT